MTANYCKPIDTSCTVDADRHLTYKTIYHVTTTDPLDGPNTAGSHPDLPTYGETYSVGNDSNSDAHVVGFDVKRISDQNSNRNWHVTVTHSTKIQNTRDTSTPHGNPLSDGGNWKISGSFQKGTKTVEVDSRGFLIQNFAFERMPYDIPYGHDTLILDGNTATISLLQRAKAMFKVNKTTIWGLPAHSILLTQWTYDILWNGQNPYVHHHLEFEINHDVDHEGNFIGWDIKLRNKGTREYNGVVDGKLDFTVFTAKDLPAGECDLNQEGRRLGPNEDTVYIPFTPIHDYEFRNLGLPTTLPPSAVFI